MINVNTRKTFVSRHFVLTFLLVCLWKTLHFNAKINLEKPHAFAALILRQLLHLLDHIMAIT